MLVAMPRNRPNPVVPAEMKDEEMSRRCKGDLDSLLLLLKNADDAEAVSNLLPSPATGARFKRADRHAELTAKLTALKTIPRWRGASMRDHVETVKRRMEADPGKEMAEAIISFGR